METNPYTNTAAPLPTAGDYLKGLSQGTELGNSSDNEQGNPYTGSSSVPTPSMGPRFQSMADSAGMGSMARAAAPIAAAGMSALSGIAPPAAAAAGAAATQAPSFGRMQSYLNQYRMQGKRDFSKDDAPANIDDAMARVAMRESNGDARAKNPHTSASGLFQHIDPTWGGHGGFSHASDAPPEMQYNRMLSDFTGSLKRNGGDVPRALMDHYLGSAGAQKLLKNPSTLYEAPGTYNGSETPFKRIASIIGQGRASQWVSDHQSKLAEAKGALENVYNVISQGDAAQASAGAGGGVY